MILADSSIWIDHLRRADEQFQALLDRFEILCHPYIIGEMALGSFADRSRLLQDLTDMPQPPIATHAEVLNLIETRCLMGLGVGYVDMHLLASTMLAPGSRLLTRDRRLAQTAALLGVVAAPL